MQSTQKISPCNTELYEQARELARQKRIEFGIKTEEINIPLLKRICKKEGIKVDTVAKISQRIRAAYFCDDDGPSILLNKSLPREPKIFAFAHELKHHFLDKKIIEDGQLQCGNYNANKSIEIAAEEFAAEFIYPLSEMSQLIKSIGIQTGNCTPEQIINLKRSISVPVSYAFIRKRLERLSIIPKDKYKEIKFQKLEEKLHPPFYKEDWFKKVRERRKFR